METWEEKSEREVHLRDYLKVVLRRKWVVIAFFVIVVVTVAINTFSMQPIYRATCQVLIERESPRVVQIEEIMKTDALWGFDYYQTQYEILKSTIIAQRVIKELNLVDHPDFNRKAKKFNFNPTHAILTVLRGIRNLFAAPRNISKNPGSQQPSDRNAQLVGAYLGRIKIQPIKESRLVNISFDAYNPELAAQAANTHAKLYIENSWERKISTSQDAVRWLNQQLKDVKRRLETSEEELQRYRKENDLVSIDFGKKQNIIASKLSGLNDALTQANTTRIEKENLFRELHRISKNPDMIESMPSAVNNTLIQNLKAQYFELGAQYSELSQKYGAEHPQMIRLRSQIKEIKGKIILELKKVAQSIETEYRLARAKEQSLINALDQQKKEALELNQKEIQYNVIQREVETNRSIYESLLRRLKEASLSEDLKVTNISIVDPARVPGGPIAPNKQRNLLMSIVVGLMGGIGLAFFFEYFDRSVKSSDEIENQLGLPFLGYVEHMNSTSSKGVAEEIRTISTNILFSIPNNMSKAVLITSAAAEEGKTLLSVNLAIVLARAGKKVLLIDTDMRNPKIHSVFNVKRTPGLSDFLTQEVDLSSVFWRTSTKGLYGISAGTSTPNPVELLMSQRMATFIKNMRENFDFIVFDATPVMMLSDPLTLASLVDGVVVVIRSGITPRPTIKKAVQQLERVNARVIGAVLNDHDVKHESYYSYSYYRKYYNRYYGEGDKPARKEKFHRTLRLS